MGPVGPEAVIALIDGEHHPPAVRDALDGLAALRPVAGVVMEAHLEKLASEGRLPDDLVN